MTLISVHDFPFGAGNGGRTGNSFRCGNHERSGGNLDSRLSSGLTGRELNAGDLPPFKAHHGAKHKLLREYVKVWLPKLGYSYPKVAIIDGFASAGRYRGNQQGSPLYLLHSFAGWKPKKEIKSPPHFIFIESKRKYAEHLQWEVDQIDCQGATVDVIFGQYETEFPKVVEYLASSYNQPVPAFSFIDPLGWKDNPFTLISEYRERLGKKAEVLVYVPASFMARFAEQDFLRPSLEKLYGGSSFEEATRAEGSQVPASERLAEAYRLRLEKEFGRATRFRIDPVRRNEYYLLFGTASPKGLSEMKRAMWKVDPVGGETYEQDAKAAVGHGQLFELSTVTTLPPEESLPLVLKRYFGDREFSIEEAETYTVDQTRYYESQLRRWGLNPLCEAGQLELIGGRFRKGQYPPGTRMRFVTQGQHDGSG